MRIGIVNELPAVNTYVEVYEHTAGVKLKSIKALVWKVSTYRAEAWTVKKEDEKQIEAAEMFF